MSPRRRPDSDSSADETEPRRALRPASPLAIGALFLWAALQVLAIALAACRVPLAAQFPTVTEFHAGQILIALQLPLAAMLMPALLSNLQSTVAAASLGGLLQFTAGLLTRSTPMQCAIVCSYLVIWVGALHVAYVASGKSLVWAGLISTAVGGAPILVYLGADISQRAGKEFLCGPVISIVQSWPRVRVDAWAFVAAMLLIAIVFRLFFRAFLQNSARQSK